MKPATVETLVWVLVYGGLITVSVGVFVLRSGALGLGWTLVALGTVAAVAGAGLVAVRSRMATAPEPEPEPQPQPQPQPQRRPPH